MPTASPDCYLIGSVPFGLTYGQWTVMWWRWALSTSKLVSPILDESGTHASIGQPEKSVWFLSGKFGSEGINFPKRYCTIPSGRSILLPVINYAATLLEFPQPITEGELIEHVNRVENTIVKKECFVNGTAIAPQRVKSDPAVFELRINKDNPADIEGSGITQASADGYWVFLKPLEKGDYFISFEGSCERGKLRSGASYQIQIQDSLPNTD